MECVVVKQPWATLAVTGATRYIVRDWRTHHRGRMAIQASRRFPRQNVELCCDEEMRAVLRDKGYDYVIQLPVQAVVGAVKVSDCIYVTEDNRASFDSGDLAVRFGLLQPGRWAWVCTEPQRLARAIPRTGRLGVFQVPDDVGDPPAPSPLRGEGWGEGQAPET
jgi:hypothetical protein